MKLYLIKLFYRFLSFILLMVMLLGFAIYYLLSSSRGAGIVLAYASDYLQENFSTRLQYEAVSGNLLSGLDLTNLHILHPQISLDMDFFSGRWNLLPLLERQIDLNSLTMQGLDLVITTTGNAGTNTQNDNTELKTQIDALFSLPFALYLREMDLSNTSISLAQQDYLITKFTGGIRLDSRALSLDRIIFNSPELDLNGSVALQSEGLLLDGNLDWTLQNPVTSERLGEVLSGALFFSGDMNNIEISHTLNQPAIIFSEGSLSTGLLDESGFNFSFEHTFSELVDIIPEQNFLGSISGTILSHGSPGLVFLDAAINLDPMEYSRVELLLSGEMQDQQISFETITANSAEFSAQALANLSLSPFNLNLEWGLDSLDLNAYLQAITLSEVSAAGRLDIDADAQANLAISFLSARLNGYPFEASGSLQLVDNNLSSVNVDLSAGLNTISLTGDLGDQINLDWSINAPELSVLLPGLTGRITGTGMASGNLDNPEINGDLQASTLQYQNAELVYTLGQLSGSVMTGPDAYLVNLSLEDMDLPLAGKTYHFRDGAISLDGSLALHQGMVQVNAENLALQFMLNGSYTDATWRSVFSAASIASLYGTWTLQEEMSLELGNAGARIAEHCWSYLQTRVCGEFDLENDDFDLNVTLDEFPLVYFNTESIISRVNDPTLNRIFQTKPVGLKNLQEAFALNLPADTYLNGFVDARFEAQGSVANLTTADFSLQLEPRDLSLNLFLQQEDERTTVQPEIRTFTVDHQRLDFFHRAGLWQANANLTVFHAESSGANIQGDITALLNMDDNENLSGTVDLDFSSIDWLETLLPDVRNTQGELSGTLDLQGTLAEPRLLANIGILGGSFELPAYGITPEQIEIDIVSNDQQNIQILASASSGAGELVFSGDADSLFTPARSFRLHLAGSDFSMINNVGTQLVISPDIELVFDNNALHVTGSVLVPEFGLDIRENQTVLLSNGTDISRDARIISVPPTQQHLLTENSTRPPQEINIIADLELSLGDNVHFQGLGLDLLLDGDLQIQQDSGRPLLAYGDISIREGVYEIYGQQLDVSNGTLIFFGNPANPALDIRAYRANSTVQAGVQINGTLRNMQSQLFSTPSLPESEILSILITGKSFGNTDDEDQSNLLGAITSLGINRGQGGLANTIRSELGLDSLALNSQADLQQSSLGLGKYLTPDIFMHYEIGLFEKESILSLDYILSERLKLEVVSGVSQSIDMTYTIEK